MKNTTHFQLFFTMFFVASITASNQAVEQDSASGYQKARATSLTAEQKSQAATNTLIKYFGQMIEKNILGITWLERLAESPNIINPILPEQYHTSDLVDTYKNQLDTLLEKGKDWFDLARIKTWAQAKIQELEHHERTRRRVHEETREVHIPMSFVEIPAGSYRDMITGEPFEVADGFEIQETPVTQLQWAQIMGNNPSHFVDGNDAEEMLIGGKKIKMRPDAPVENVSYKQVQEFITKLNEREKNNTSYIYALPSVREYQVLMQSVLGANWLEQTQHVKTCGDTEKTCIVTSSDYMLTPNKQRVFGLVGHVWQWTRDMVNLGKYEGKDIDARLVFGSSYATRLMVGMSIQKVLRPVLSDGGIGGQLGVRLVRHARDAVCLQENFTYAYDKLRWVEHDVILDTHWHWNKKLGNLCFENDELRWMIEHKSDCSQETQHTIDVLLQEVPVGHDPIVYLTNHTVFYLWDNQIKDLSPLANLTNLTWLYLEGNQIKDLSPLANLTNLTGLYLRNNKIEDLSFLANLTKLTQLDLCKNQIEDLSFLANLTNLTSLNLGQNQIKDLSPLTNLTNLIGLYLSNNQIKDLSPLANLTNLTYLDLEGNQIKDLSSLANLTNLAWLYLKNNPIKDFSPLSQLKKLTLFLDKKQLDQLGANAKSILPYADIKIG